MTDKIKYNITVNGLTINYERYNDGYICLFCDPDTDVFEAFAANSKAVIGYVWEEKGFPFPCPACLKTHLITPDDRIETSVAIMQEQSKQIHRFTSN